MMERNQAEEMTRAADRFAEAARELASTMDRFLEYQERSWDRFEEHRRRGEEPWERSLPVEPHARELSEREAVELALATTHEVRGEMGRGLESEERLSALSPDDVRRRREERREREDGERP